MNKFLWAWLLTMCILLSVPYAHAQSAVYIAGMNVTPGILPPADTVSMGIESLSVSGSGVAQERSGMIVPGLPALEVPCWGHVVTQQRIEYVIGSAA